MAVLSHGGGEARKAEKQGKMCGVGLVEAPDVQVVMSWLKILFSLRGDLAGVVLSVYVYSGNLQYRVMSCCFYFL